MVATRTFAQTASFGNALERTNMLKHALRFAGLAIMLLCFETTVYASSIQKQDGQWIRGDIQGSIGIKSTTENITYKGKEYAAIFYTLIDGSRIAQIDPTRAIIGLGQQNLLAISWEPGSSAQTPSDTQALSETAVSLPSGVSIQFGIFSTGAEWAKMLLSTSKSSTEINSIFASVSSSASGTNAPSLTACPTIGKILGTYTSSDNRLVPWVTVNTTEGVVNIPVNEIAVFVGSTSKSLTLSVGSADTASTLSGAGPLQVGYASADVTTGAAPFGTAVFSYRQNNIIVSEVGVPASIPTPSARVFIDYRVGAAASPSPGKLDINTGLAVVNPSTKTANVTYTLRDINGNILAAGHGTIASKAHFSKFINQLKDVAPDFNLPADFATATCYGSLEITSSQALSIIALRLTINQRGDVLLTTTPIADLTQFTASSPLYFPQIADGGGYVTTILLLNTSNSHEGGSLEFFDDKGAPLVVKRVGGSAASTFFYTIQPAGAYIFQTDGSPDATAVGSLRLTPDLGTSAPAGSAIFRNSSAEIIVTESGVPATKPTYHAHVYVDMSGGHDTGIAVAAPDSAGTSILIKAFEKDGATPAGQGQTTVSLWGNGHRAAFASELISGLSSGFTGILELSSPSPFAALALRSLFNSRKDFLLTTFPIADANITAPAPIVFPQIAAGDGYVTQFILLSSTDQANVTLNFIGDDGTPLPIGK
jgi:hypothetical protein